MSRRLLRYVDWPLLAVTLALMAAGTVILYSAVQNSADPGSVVRMRLAHIAVSLVVLAAVLAVDYRTLARLWRPLWAGAVLLLVLVLVAGRSSGGAQRWLAVGSWTGFQPSELAKVTLVITLARHIDSHRDVGSWRAVVSVLLHAAVPMALIARQPDLGTALALGAVLAALLFVAGAPLRVLVGLGAGAAALAPVAWGMLHDYQRQRLLAFLDPAADPLGAGYALIQSRIAVGSGQIWGKGLLRGTQNLLHFIPEQHTDFIFTVVGEELGFVGAVALVGLFALWLWRGAAIAAAAKDRTGMLMAVGAVALTAFHVFVNVGMTVGLMPITGIPLPFISHGGSALVAFGALTGLVLNVGMRRKKILF
ncbi:MAG: rod shape-determining protein RodA [Armatimonadota bacterium]|nr:rod shape-determining protein RodA [Armatimonadota bacterium]MDR7437916.1 rod shape-determining protein RodA [Armatimonadota bacterium]MDR7472141.1 rod shape-determining protein RodA [Armatimonadota bacterium]MDR7507114.1 rod shape-determining protein RodA [Armatimonadota bacterium]MDR7508745.1 rod shape-determining protein RodA [Armatimonadota bacterium]